MLRIAWIHAGAINTNRAPQTKDNCAYTRITQLFDSTVKSRHNFAQIDLDSFTDVKELLFRVGISQICWFVLHRNAMLLLSMSLFLPPLHIVPTEVGDREQNKTVLSVLCFALMLMIHVVKGSKVKENISYSTMIFVQTNDLNCCTATC